MAGTQVPVGNTEIHLQLARIEEQNKYLLQVVQMGQVHLTTRIDDLKSSHDKRFVAQEARLEKLEHYERETALSAAKWGAVSGAVASGLLAVAKAFLK